VAPAAAQDAKAGEILAAARKAIGDKKLDALKTLSVQASVQRNLGNMQMQSEVEMDLEMPDKYVRTDVSSGMMNITISTGFNGDRAILPANASAGPGGAMVIRMGGPGSMSSLPTEKPTPEQIEELNKSTIQNARQEVSRMTLGWFAAVHPSLKAHYSYVGEAESPDGKAYVIDVKDDDGFAARLFIDQNSKLPLMVTYKGRQARMMTSTMGAGRQAPAGQPRPQLTEEEAKKQKEDRDKQLADLKNSLSQPTPMVDFSLFFEDWREVDGVNFPHLVRRASEGTTSEEWKINKVKFNPKIDAKKFAVESR
jgi:hypothetical protein